MKNKSLIVLTIIAVFAVLGMLHAQGGSQTSFGTIPGLLTGCPPPAVGQDWVCDVAGVGYENSMNGAPYAPLGGGVQVPVTSVFGRTGVIKALTGDYSFTSIGGSIAASQLPTTITCTGTITTPAQATFVSGTQVQTGATVVLTGCK